MIMTNSYSKCWFMLIKPLSNFMELKSSWRFKNVFVPLLLRLSLYLVYLDKCAWNFFVIPSKLTFVPNNSEFYEFCLK